MRQLAETFRNLIPLDRAQFPFTDAFSQFGMTFEPGRALGPSMIEPRSVAMSAQPSDCTFSLFVREAGHLVPVMRQDIEHLPWMVTERGSLACATGRLSVTGRSCFTGVRQLVHEVDLHNAGAEAVSCEPVWLGNLCGDRWGPKSKELQLFALEPQPLRHGRVLCDQGRVTATVSDPNGILPGPGFRITTSGDLALTSWCSLAAAWTDPQERSSDLTITDATGIGFALEAGPVTIAPGARLRVRAVVDVSVTSHACPTRAWPDPAPGLGMEALLSAAENRFARNVGWSRAPRTHGPAHQAKAWRARWALLRTGYQADGNGGEYGHEIATTCVANHWGFTRNFFWDALFSSVAAARFHPDFAKGCIRSVFSRQDAKTGFCPEHSFNYWVANACAIAEPQAPVASWAVERYLRLHDDPGFLKEIYPKLLINHRHWLERGDRDGDGLAEWTWAGQTADDSPLWDEFTGKAIGYLPPVASVQLNAFLYRDALILATFADRLGLVADATLLRSSAAKRQEALMTICFLPDEHLFLDYNHATRRHTRVKTFYLFWPLWAGMTIPAATTTHLIENVLLDPKQFYGPVPFPSVAYDEPSYDPTGYWRGKAWPQISYWLIEMLEERGYADAAQKARDRVLANWCADPSFPENHVTSPHAWEAQSSPDYNWGIALASLLLEDVCH